MAIPTSTSPGKSTPKAFPNLYFAYGSNLSPTQMALRFPTPTSALSATPLAVARLDNYQWIICQAGYSNVVPVPVHHPHASGQGQGQDKGRRGLDPNTTVYGILYNLDPADERILDMYEGHTPERNPNPEPNYLSTPDNSSSSSSSSSGAGTTEKVLDPERPFHQGSWVYNKHYLPVRIVKWLPQSPSTSTSTSGLSSPSNPATAPETAETAGKEGTEEEEETLRALVYVDEHRTRPGQINNEYIGRMNRAIAESVALGLPQDWVDAVIRRDVVPGFEAEDPNYIGGKEC